MKRVVLTPAPSAITIRAYLGIHRKSGKRVYLRLRVV